MKLPVSVLVVVHAAGQEVLLLERAGRAGFWQSVTGALERAGEPLAQAAARELREETGIDAASGRLRRWDVAYTFEIFAQWRHRFAPGVTHNTEHLFSLELARREPVALAPQEHTAFTWLPWREAARKCFSWSNRDAILMIGAALLATGCTTTLAQPAAPLAAHLQSGTPEARECAQWLQALDAEVDAAGVRDARDSRVAGFPHLRVDRLLASLRERAAEDASALRSFTERLAELDLQARRHEIQNLSSLTMGARAALLQRARDCGRVLRAADLASAEARGPLLAAAAVPGRKSIARGGGPATAGVTESRSAPAAIRVRYAPPSALQIPREVVAGMLGRAAFDPLGHPALSEREFERIAPIYAPSFEIEIGGDQDRFGRLRWTRTAAGGAPEVDTTQPTVYIDAAYTRYRMHVLLQLVYTVWFGSSSLDGIAWRVTLAPDGEPLVYDAIHVCGSSHVFFPTARARPGAPADAGDRPIVPHTLPRVAEGERPVVRLAPGTRAVQRVELVQGADSLVRYAFRGYDELRSLPRTGGQFASIFASDGSIAATTCAQPVADVGLFDARFAFEL